MLKSILKGVAGVLLAGFAYLTLWPVPIDPVAWEAPQNPGYTGPYATKDRFTGLERIALKGEYGPEDAAEGPDGTIYIPSHGGAVLAYDPKTDVITEFANTGGLPLGVITTQDGSLYIADAALGLLEITPDGEVTVLTNTIDGESIDFADALDIAPDGSIYFTDASSKFGAVANGGGFQASLLEMMEHRGNGRVLRYDPETQNTTTILEGLHFANGIAMNAEGTHFLVAETGNYSVKRVSLDGSEVDTILENTPGVPDNIARAQDGTFWVGLVTPRSQAADDISSVPFMRKLLMRLPTAMMPDPVRYGMVVRINEVGEVLETLQDPSGDYALVTGLVEARDGTRYLTSFVEDTLGKLPAK